jgi:muramoyltetrapeptide carboxypeptidase LdcA involved in peptidoglycan recycling
MTLRTGIATLHTNNLMNTPYRLSGQLKTWLDIASLATGTSFTQSSPGWHNPAWPTNSAKPGATRFGGDGRWIRLDASGPAADVRGRLIGGCIETVRHLAGTPYGDIARFAEEHAPGELIVYVEAADADAFAVCRSLHGMRLAGFFAGAQAVLVARTMAPDNPTLTQKEAVIDALGRLGVPIIAEIGCGHVPPYVPIVNGALAHLKFSADGASLTQSLS